MYENLSGNKKKKTFRIYIYNSLIQVNNIDVTRMECSQVVPLLSTSPDELMLVVGRRPAPMFDETDELFDIDEDEDEKQQQIQKQSHHGSKWNPPITHTTATSNYALLSHAK